MKKYFQITLVIAAFMATSCEVEEFSDLNGPEASELMENLTRGDLRDLTGGIFYIMRSGLGGYLQNVGIVGREYYRFSSAEPRYTYDLLGREDAVLEDRRGRWSTTYRIIKNINVILEGLENSTADFSEQELNATRGFLNTIKAYELLLNLNLTDENGIRLDINDKDTESPIVSKDEALTGIRALFDQAASQLVNGGDSFPFEMTSGFEGFDSPETFLQVNQALLARVAAYQEDYTGVLDYLENSFMDLNGDLEKGVYYVFSENQNDMSNPLFFQLNATTAGAIVAQPDVVPDAEVGDQRVQEKLRLRDETITMDNLSSDYDFHVYPSRTAPIPIIRNAELVLLYAEANIFNGVSEAVMALNVIRNNAGLEDYSGGTSQEALITEMLHQRRYELYGEGHRWIDARRYEILDQLPIDRPGDDVWSKFPIPVLEFE